MSQTVVHKNVWGNNTHFHGFGISCVIEQFLPPQVVYLYSRHRNLTTQGNLFFAMYSVLLIVISQLRSQPWLQLSLLIEVFSQIQLQICMVMSSEQNEQRV